MDLTKLSTDDLLALREGDLTRVSDAGLQLLKQQDKADRVAAQAAADRELYSPVKGMSFLEKVVAGNSKIVRDGANAVAGLVGLGPSKEELAEKERLDAPLMNTLGGKIGAGIGGFALAAPVMAAAGPAGATAAGAGAMGAITGYGFTPGDVGDRLRSAAVTAAGGVAGKYLGDAVGSVAGRFLGNRAAKAAAEEAANAGRDAAAASAQDAGYVLPPAAVQAKGGINAALEALGGKVKTNAAASARNQSITNSFAREAVGLPADAPITREALQAIRSEAGKAYEALRGTGTVTADQAYIDGLDAIAKQYAGSAKAFPGLGHERVQSLVDSLKQPAFEMDAAVDALRNIRATADTAFSQGDKTLGKAAKEAGQELEGAIERHLAQTGQGDKLGAFRDARTLIARTYSVEQALNAGTGNVSAAKLALQLHKGKPLQDGLKTAAEAGAAFPKAMQSGAEVPAFSVADVGFSGLSGALAHPALAALPLARPAARSVMLSEPYQRLMVKPTYGPGLLARGAGSLDTDIARTLIRQGSIVGVLRQAQPIRLESMPGDRILTPDELKSYAPEGSW